jgi:hypothetical protein
MLGTRRDDVVIAQSPPFLVAGYKARQNYLQDFAGPVRRVNAATVRPLRSGCAYVAPQYWPESLDFRFALFRTLALQACKVAQSLHRFA